MCRTLGKRLRLSSGDGPCGPREPTPGSSAPGSNPTSPAPRRRRKASRRTCESPGDSARNGELGTDLLPAAGELNQGSAALSEEIQRLVRVQDFDGLLRGFQLQFASRSSPMTASIVLQSKLLFLSLELDKSDLTRRFALMLYASARHSPSRRGVPFGARPCSSKHNYLTTWPKQCTLRDGPISDVDSMLAKNRAAWRFSQSSAFFAQLFCTSASILSHMASEGFCPIYDCSDLLFYVFHRKSKLYQGSAYHPQESCPALPAGVRGSPPRPSTHLSSSSSARNG